MKGINNWKFISRFGKNGFVKRTYIFLILLPFTISTLKKFRLEHVIDSIPFSWHMFFFSAVFFTIGTIIYNLFAPSIIKENSSYADFRNAGKDWDHIDMYAEEHKIPFDDYVNKEKEFKNKHGITYMTSEAFDEFIKTIDEKDKAMFKFLYGYYRKQKSANPNLNFGTSDRSEEVEFKKYEHYVNQLEKNSQYNLKAAFWKIYEYAKFEKLTARSICLIAFIIGTIFTVIVTLNSIYIVISNGNFQIFKG